MKNSTLFTLLIALLLSSCTDILDRTPQGVYTLDNFFQTEEQAVQSVNAVYAQLRTWETHVFSYIGMTDIVSDDADKGSFPSDGFFLQEVDDFTHTATNVAPSSVWSGYYEGIFRANLAIENLPNVPEMNEDLRARLIAESKCIRGYLYFNLVRWFGDVPLILQPFPDNFSIPRAPAEAVYAQIIADLSDAAAVLPEKSAYTAANVGRVTKGTANGLLAKVYLTRNDFINAEEYARRVINSNQYALLPRFATNFTTEGENGTESIFEIQSSAFETGGGGSQYNEVQGVRGEPNLGWGFNRPSDDLVSSFETGDPRREATILYVGEVLPDGSDIVQDNPNIVGERYNQKAFVSRSAGVGGNGNGPGNIRILRYADLLLIAAEAANENNDPGAALGFINQVRRRARGSSQSVLRDLTTTNKDELRELIYRERRSELALEQNRWFDLVRTGRAASIMQGVGKNFVEGTHELFPIPQGEIDLSQGALTQNRGY